MIAFFPGWRVFVFGHPSHDVVIDRFLEREKYSCVPVFGGQVLYEHVHRQYPPPTLSSIGFLRGRKTHVRLFPGASAT